MSRIPYTHWSYFKDQVAAETCGRELDVRFDCLSAVDESDWDGERQWRLLAARTVSLGWPNGWHAEIEEVVERYGGFYDGGESGWLDTITGKFVEMAEGGDDA
jgi:hypothetical protein